MAYELGQWGSVGVGSQCGMGRASGVSRADSALPITHFTSSSTQLPLLPKLQRVRFGEYPCSWISQGFSLGHGSPNTV